MARSKNTYVAQITCFMSVFTAPFHAIATSMQLSVIPHLTVYGDVKESEVKKPGVVRSRLEGIGMIEAKAPAESKEVLNEVKSDIMKMPEKARADLMEASGQVGLNKPYRAPVYRNYWECVQGLYR